MTHQTSKDNPDYATIEKTNEVIAHNLKNIRQSYGLSQGQMGKILRCTPQQIQKYENNVNRLSIAQMLILAEHFGVEPHVFYKQEHTPSQSNSTYSPPQHIGECLSYLTPIKRHFLLRVAQELMHV